MFAFLQATECSTAVAGRANLNMGTKPQLVDEDADAADVAEDDSDAIAQEEVVLVLVLAGVAL